MAWQYSKHYTREEARALLPRIRTWLGELDRHRELLRRSDEKMLPLLDQGSDLGGQLVDGWVRTLAQVKSLIAEFQSREIEIKDLDRGLIDFPAFIGGKEVFLCWEKDEEDIEFWHDLASGYAGRERIE
jgi:hypothetical protein